ncbi:MULTISPECIES: metal-dependent hydrolase family protein [Microbacterium]|jgi:imidazolonepropionase-like amidohydrolase|uniref:metal-dependent hydrolase family protein n=1 Tax=Microbacterium TaxID=33882 RepID=UPI001D173B05|nr:amidohydrolase family protein [Microbacterium testaceum]MCC4248666.1 amidohydrolase family protein [Microbacterium testaceum]
MSARLPHVPPAAGDLRLVGATVIDGTGGDPIDDAEIGIRAGRMDYVGPRRADGAGGREIDLGGRWVMPGFIDAHVHLVMSTTVDAETQRLWFPEEAVVATIGNLRSTLEAGVTTARDLSGLTPGYRSAIASGALVGPRLHLAISMLSPTGGHADPVHANGSLPAWAERGLASGCAVVDTLDEVVRTVRALVRTGADVIKVCTSGGVSTPHDSPSDTGLPREHVAAIVAEMAGRAGQPVTAHAQTDAAVRAAVEGGAASIEHGYDLSDETIALMRDRGVVLVPTLSTLLRVPSGPPDAVRQARQERGLASISAAVAAGVPVALGTDAGIHEQGRNLTELAHLVRVGLSPVAAIHAGTLAGARLLRLDRDLGSVQQGKLADLVIADVDPLRDIGALADPDRVRAVVQAGRFVKDLDGLAR